MSFCYVDNLLLLNRDSGKLMVTPATMRDELDSYFRDSSVTTANRLCPLRETPTYRLHITQKIVLSNYV